MSQAKALFGSVYGFVVVMVFTLAIAACSTEPDDAALRRILNEMESAIESGDVGAFMQPLDPEFTAQSGAMDARQLRATLLALRLRHENLSVNPGPAAVQLFDDRATIRLKVLATGGAWLPETGQLFEIESHWRRVDGDWLCFSANWETALN